MSQSLASLERAKLSISSASSGDDRLIDALLAAASSAIRRWCGRDFALREYDQVLDGQWGGRLLLPCHPVTAVQSVRRGPSTVLQIENTATSTNQQARVAVARSGLELLRTASGTRVIDTTVTWASYAILSAIAAAVNLLGNGWSATAASGYGSWPSQDLFVDAGEGTDRSSGMLDCRGRKAGLRLHVEELADYGWSAAGWLTLPGGLLLDGRDEGRLDPWAGGPGCWRVQYTAGFATVPPAVEEACCLWVAELFGLSKRDPALSSTSTASTAGGETEAESAGYAHVSKGMPGAVRALLSPYKARQV